MIGKLTGRFSHITAEGAALVDVGGVGYTVSITLSTAEGLPKGSPDVSLFIHTAVREDAFDLYGFATEEELSFFKMLLSVSGIGPKTALSIMDVADVRLLKDAVAAGDTSYLTKVFGIGKKSAERIVVELKDKLTKEGYGATKTGGGDGDVLDALVAMGYTALEARNVVAALPQNISGASAKLKEALKTLGMK